LNLLFMSEIEMTVANWKSLGERERTLRISLLFIQPFYSKHLSLFLSLSLSKWYLFEQLRSAAGENKRTTEEDRNGRNFAQSIRVFACLFERACACVCGWCLWWWWRGWW
jgi:hypothetical protein